MLYSRHRRADPRIAAQIEGALADASSVLDVGAGTGSYEPRSRKVLAVEPSEVMVRQRPPNSAPVVRAVAESLPLASACFDAALAVLTLHHWSDPLAGLRELCRVASRIVILTFDPVLHSGLWVLTDYLPESNELVSNRCPDPGRVAEEIGATRVETVPVPHDCVDGFNWAYWRRPWAYLDAEVRSCISGIAQLPPQLVGERMTRLRRDLDSGAWHDKHGDLLQENFVDGGFRLVVRD